MLSVPEQKNDKRTPDVIGFRRRRRVKFVVQTIILTMMRLEDLTSVQVYGLNVKAKFAAS